MQSKKFYLILHLGFRKSVGLNDDKKGGDYLHSCYRKTHEDPDPRLTKNEIDKRMVLMGI